RFQVYCFLLEVHWHFRFGGKEEPALPPLPYPPETQILAMAPIPGMRALGMLTTPALRQTRTLLAISQGIPTMEIVPGRSKDSRTTVNTSQHSTYQKTSEFRSNS